MIYDLNNFIIMNDVPITGSDMLCFICQDFFCRPYAASCGHSFCQYCLHQYLLFSEQCPSCSKFIRNKAINPVPVLGQFVQRCLKNDKKQIQGIEKRKKFTKQYFSKKCLKIIKVGLKVDIRDSNYIWCEGMIIRILTKGEQNEKFVRVVYINYLQHKEDDVPVNSERLAMHRFYSSRKDIPYYQQKKDNVLIKKLQQ